MKQANSPKPAYALKKGDEVRIIDGPFSNFPGIIEEVNLNTLKVSIEIMGRKILVQLDFLQVEKISR
jgi:transcription termination/antitermination protein NusG